MPAHKRKPYYNGSITMQELLTAVCEFYGDPVDDRKQEDPDHVSLHDVADRFDITVMKARKLLITGGLYSTSLSRKVQELHAQGLTVAQITEETGLKRASINSYLPYASGRNSIGSGRGTTIERMPKKKRSSGRS